MWIGLRRLLLENCMLENMLNIASSDSTSDLLFKGRMYVYVYVMCALWLFAIWVSSVDLTIYPIYTIRKSKS